MATSTWISRRAIWPGFPAACSFTSWLTRSTTLKNNPFTQKDLGATQGDAKMSFACARAANQDQVMCKAGKLSRCQVVDMFFLCR